MDEAKYKIYENIVLLVIVLSVIYPINSNYLVEKEKYPDVPVEQRQVFPIRQLFFGGASASAFIVSTDSDIATNYPYKSYDRS